MQVTAGEAETSSGVMFSYEPSHLAEQKQVDQLEPTYSSSVRTRAVALGTYQKRWTTGRSGERWSVISVLAARHDNDDANDDDDDFHRINRSNSSISNNSVQHASKVKWFQVLLFITNNLIKPQLFIYTQLNVKTVVFQTIQFSRSTQFKCQTVKFDSLIGPIQILALRTRMAMKGYSAFPKALALMRPHHQIV